MWGKSQIDDVGISVTVR